MKKIAAESEVDAFLGIVGPKTYSLLKNLVYPANPVPQLLDVLMEALNDYLSPRLSVTTERAEFHQYVQQESQAISAFLAELKRLAQYCKFAANLDDALRDRFVCGSLRIDIQKCLFAEDETVTFKKAIEKAVSLEAATRNTAECHQPAPAFELKKMAPAPERQATRACYRCDADNHSNPSCPFRDSVCHEYRKKGYIARACQSRTKSNPMQSHTNSPLCCS